ncbi:MAG: hypothetical protein KAR33_00125 [Candidatus Thorarchaeota archaeon]|nr:hypothetical protein [Candidatus Thorarchaeota archaeon]
MVKEILILRVGGIPLFHYSVSDEKKLDELVAGFLSALGAFAEEVGEQQIKVMSFAQNKFVWERKGDLYFIALVAMDDSEEIYRAILQNLSDQFVSKYYSELRKDIVAHKEFYEFTETLEVTLQKFDGIPGIARRYKTGLLPLASLRSLKLSLTEIESAPQILRGALVTLDGFIVVSNLRTYELEAALDRIGRLDPSIDLDNSRFAKHSSLEPKTSFFLYPAKNIGIASFIVLDGVEPKILEDAIDPFIRAIKATSFEEMKKVYPLTPEKQMGFYDYDVIIPTPSLNEVMDDFSRVSAGLPSSALANILAFVRAADGNRTILEIQEAANLSEVAVTEAIANLVMWGAVQVAQLFPVIGERDDRFAAYLEVIGIPKKEFDILDIIWKYCTGGLSIREISEKSNIQPSRIVEILRKLGNYVTWQQERRLEHDRPNN